MEGTAQSRLRSHSRGDQGGRPLFSHVGKEKSLQRRKTVKQAE